MKQAGVKTLWANEVSPFAAATFSANHPDVDMKEGDVKDFSAVDFPPVDILIAGFPCQSFSQAGERRGFDDERGRLFFEIPRIIAEFGDHRPPIILLENVPHLMDGSQGEWFARVISEVQFAGYWFGRDNCRVLNTAEISELPHRRERLFMAALSVSAFDCNDFRFPEKNGKPLDLKKMINRSKKSESDDYLPDDNRFRKIIVKKMAEGTPNSIYHLRRYYAREYPRECPTLTANMGGGGHNVPFVRDRWGIRRLTVDECAKLQGFNNYIFPDSVPQRERYRQIGNAVSVPIAAKLGLECARLVRQLEKGAR